jgi:hypothetical protein
MGPQAFALTTRLWFNDETLYNNPVSQGNHPGIPGLSTVIGGPGHEAHEPKRVYLSDRAFAR